MNLLKGDYLSFRKTLGLISAVSSFHIFHPVTPSTLNTPSTSGRKKKRGDPFRGDINLIKNMVRLRIPYFIVSHVSHFYVRVLICLHVVHTNLVIKLMILQGICAILIR